MAIQEGAAFQESGLAIEKEDAAILAVRFLEEEYGIKVVSSRYSASELKISKDSLRAVFSYGGAGTLESSISTVRDFATASQIHGEFEDETQRMLWKKAVEARSPELRRTKRGSVVEKVENFLETNPLEEDNIIQLLLALDELILFLETQPRNHEWLSFTAEIEEKVKRAAFQLFPDELKTKFSATHAQKLSTGQIKIPRSEESFSDAFDWRDLARELDENQKRNFLDVVGEYIFEFSQDEDDEDEGPDSELADVYMKYREAIQNGRVSKRIMDNFIEELPESMLIYLYDMMPQEDKERYVSALQCVAAETICELRRLISN